MPSSMAWKVVFCVFSFHVIPPPPTSTLHFLSCLHKTRVRKLLTVLNSVTFPFCPCPILEASLMLHLGRLDKWNCSKSCVWIQGKDRLESWKLAKTNLNEIASLVWCCTFLHHGAGWRYFCSQMYVVCRVSQEASAFVIHEVCVLQLLGDISIILVSKKGPSLAQPSWLTP